MQTPTSKQTDNPGIFAAQQPSKIEESLVNLAPLYLRTWLPFSKIAGSVFF